MNRLQERRMALGLTQPQVSARLKETEPRADVGIMLNQLCLIFGDPTEEEILKLLRLEQRIEAEADQP